MFIGPNSWSQKWEMEREGWRAEVSRLGGAGDEAARIGGKFYDDYEDCNTGC